MKELVIFDIDKTLVDGQSQKRFLRYLLAAKRVKLTFFLKLIPWFVLYELGLLRDPKKPMRYAYSFLKGKSVQEISGITRDFFERDLKNHIYPEAVELIKEHQDAGREVILVSNSAELIVKDIADYLGVSQYICTKLETVDGKYTGEIKDIMYGHRKAEAINKFADNHHLDLGVAWAYGDHASDRQLLSLVKHPVAVNPSPTLMATAKKSHWQTMKFKDIEK